MRHRLAALAAAGALLAGCGNGAPRTFNDADVMFLQMLVAHHGQGVRIARLAEDRAPRPEVRTLAAAIETTQISEIRTMASWLRRWHRPPTPAPGGHAEHAGHGGMPETSETEIKKLGKEKGTTFERRFLNLLIAHQDDAVQLARAQTAGGYNAPAKDLAGRVERSRTAQIQQMKTYLDPR